MKSSRSFALVVVLAAGLLLAGCSGSAGQPSKDSSDSSETSAPTTQTPAEPEGPHPWAGSSFSLTQQGEPQIVASSGYDATRASFADNGDGTYEFRFEFTSGPSDGYSSTSMEGPQFKMARDSDVAAALMPPGAIIGEADGTAHWEMGPHGSGWANCPAEAIPGSEKATDVVIGSDGRVESLVIDLPRLETNGQCSTWALIHFPVKLTRID